jgi:hypothetical protein
LARAETVTLLPPDRWAAIMQIPICHFNGIDGAKSPLRGGCDGLWDQEDRDVLGQYMGDAELLIADELGTWPAPKWITCEEQMMGRVRDDWWNAELKTKWTHVQAFGVQTLTLIDGAAPVTYENRRHDYYGREETAVIGEPAAMYYYPSGDCSGICNVHVFFTESDGAWDSADPRWEIRPLQVDAEPPGTRVYAESCLFLKPELQKWQYKSEWPSGEEWWSDFDINNLVSEVDVYCESTNTTLPAALRWDGLDGCTSYPCQFEDQDACAQVTDALRGYFALRPATGANALNSALYGTPPTKVVYSYRAGWPLNSRTCRMDPRLERAVVKLTNSLLPEPPCSFCDRAKTIWENDRKTVEPLTEAASLCPWGFSQGAVEAYRIVRLLAEGRGGNVRG